MSRIFRSITNAAERGLEKVITICFKENDEHITHGLFNLVGSTRHLQKQSLQERLPLAIGIFSFCKCPLSSYLYLNISVEKCFKRWSMQTTKPLTVIS